MRRENKAPISGGPLIGGTAIVRSSWWIWATDASSRAKSKPAKSKPAQPKPIPGMPDKALASMGIYIFNAKFLYEQVARDADEPKSSHDFGKDIIPHMVPRYRVFAHRFGDSCVAMNDNRPYWRDVGTVDAYFDANIDLVHVIPDLSLYDNVWPIWTYQEQLPPAKFVFDDEGRRGTALDSMISGGCILSGSTVRRSVLFSNVRVHSFCDIEDAVILPDVVINRHVKLKRVVIDKGCVLPEGFQAGLDPEQDKRRFYVSKGGITLVTPGMLGQKIHVHH